MSQSMQTREARSRCVLKHLIEALVLHEACLPKSGLCLFCMERDPKQKAKSYRSTDVEFLRVTRSCPV